MADEQPATHRVTVEEAKVVRTTYLIAVPPGTDPTEHFYMLHDGDMPAEGAETVRSHWEVAEVEALGG